MFIIQFRIVLLPGGLQGDAGLLTDGDFSTREAETDNKEQMKTLREFFRYPSPQRYPCFGFRSL